MLGSAHRGRLNILAELLEYPHTALFHKIKGNCEFPADLEVSGDAISHLGKLPDSTEHLSFQESHNRVNFSCFTLSKLRRVIRTDQGFFPPKPLAFRYVCPLLFMACSELLRTEAVNPVALGKTRAKQYSLLKTSPDDCKLGDRVMCVQLHGDASFSAQGIVMEGLGLSNLPHFTTGGTVHIVVK